ncbi:Reverse transcriptase domain [Trinorchestia longiramus]|nr:Reverse transcriptase domain [Trinorchestia longiramus]
MTGGKTKKAATRDMIECMTCKTWVDLETCKGLTEMSQIYRLGNLVTGQVRSVRGVRQDCTLSPLLFGLYTEELAVGLRISGYGLNVGEEKLSCLLNADNIVVVSESEQELRRLLKIVDGYSRDFKVKFGGDRSKVMGINFDETDKDREYLGCMLNEDGCAGAKDEKVVKAMQWWGRLSSVAKYRANKYECVRGIWKCVAVPSIMFGVNVMAWNGVLQNRVAGLALGTLKWTAVQVIRGI